MAVDDLTMGGARSIISSHGIERLGMAYYVACMGRVQPCRFGNHYAYMGTQTKHGGQIDG